MLSFMRFIVAFHERCGSSMQASIRKCHENHLSSLVGTSTLFLPQPVPSTRPPGRAMGKLYRFKTDSYGLSWRVGM